MVATEGGAKGYDGTIVLGSETDTLDHEGATTARFEGELPDREAVEKALNDVGYTVGEPTKID